MVRHGVTPDDVMAAAKQRFLADGYEATKIRDVAGDLGVSVGHIYCDFPSKRAILTGIVADGNQRLMEQYLAPAALADGEPFLRVLGVAQAYFQFFLDERPLAKLMAMNVLLDSDADDPAVGELAEMQVTQFARSEQVFSQLDLGPGLDAVRVMRWCWGALYGQLMLNIRLPHLAVDDDELDRIIGTGMRMLDVTLRAQLAKTD